MLHNPVEIPFLKIYSKCRFMKLHFFLMPKNKIKNKRKFPKWTLAKVKNPPCKKCVMSGSLHIVLEIPALENQALKHIHICQWF